MFEYLFGLSYDVYTLVDNDKAGRKAISTISEDDETNSIVDKLKTYFLKETKTDDCLLENLFSHNDRKKYIPPKSTVNYKEIYDNYGDIEFEQETLDNFSNLLHSLKENTKHIKDETEEKKIG